MFVTATDLRRLRDVHDHPSGNTVNLEELVLRLVPGVGVTVTENDRPVAPGSFPCPSFGKALPGPGRR